MAWTDERVELLKRLWAEGLSASQIANRLGGVTRNAVIGKVHRLGLSGRATTSRVKATRPRKRRATAPPRRPTPMHYPTQGGAALKADIEPVAGEDIVPVAVLVEELYIPPDKRASILTLNESMCRWPIGDPNDEDFHFCGRDSTVGVPYCDYHSGVAYQPVQSRRRDKRA